MKCSEFLDELTNYLDGVLDARTKTELEDHLAWCHNCYVVCDTTKKTIEIYRDSHLYVDAGDLLRRLGEEDAAVAEYLRAADRAVGLIVEWADDACPVRRPAAGLEDAVGPA